jgi:hypothetical protein
LNSPQGSVGQRGEERRGEEEQTVAVIDLAVPYFTVLHHALLYLMDLRCLLYCRCSRELD